MKIIHVGENGKGTTLKLINNLIMGVAIEAVAEALVLAAKPGSIPERSWRSPPSAGPGPAPWKPAARE